MDIKQRSSLNIPARRQAMFSARPINRAKIEPLGQTVEVQSNDTAALASYNIALETSSSVSNEPAVQLPVYVDPPASMETPLAPTAENKQFSVPEQFIVKSKNDYLHEYVTKAKTTLSKLNTKKVYIPLAILTLFLVGDHLYQNNLPHYVYNSYRTAIEKPYNLQVNEMKKVYATTNSSMFNGSIANTDIINPQVASINAEVSLASTYTANLKASNSYFSIPGTNKSLYMRDSAIEKSAIADYVGKSNRFLSDYKSMLAYMSTASSISGDYAATLSKDIAAIETNNKNTAQFSSTVSTTNNDVQALSSKVNQLKNYPDVINIASPILLAYTSLASDISSLSQSANNQTALSSVANNASTFTKLLQTTPYSIKSQVATLESTQPLN